MAIIEVDSFYRPLIETDVIKHRRSHMNKATYDRIMKEVKERTRMLQGDRAYFQEDILKIVSTSLKIAIAEELLNRNCGK